MNKTVIIVIGIVAIAGAIIAFKTFNNPPVPEPTPVATPEATPSPQGTPAPTSPAIKPPTASSNVLDRIEAAIRAKLKR